MYPRCDNCHLNESREIYHEKTGGREVRQPVFFGGNKEGEDNENARRTELVRLLVVKEDRDMSSEGTLNILVEGCWGWSCQARAPEEDLRGEIRSVVRKDARGDGGGGFIETPEKQSYLKRVFLIFPSINQFQTVEKNHSTAFHLKIHNTSRSWRLACFKSRTRVQPMWWTQIWCKVIWAVMQCEIVSIVFFVYNLPHNTCVAA